MISPEKEVNKSQQQSLHSNIVMQIEENDVLLGRGAPIINNRGNIYFRKVVHDKKSQYIFSCRHQVKNRIAKEVVDHIRSKKGRFLRKVDAFAEARELNIPAGTPAWVIAEEVVVMQKVKQALREHDSSKGEKKVDMKPPQRGPTSKNMLRSQKIDKKNKNVITTLPQPLSVTNACDCPIKVDTGLPTSVSHSAFPSWTSLRHQAGNSNKPEKVDLQLTQEISHLRETIFQRNIATAQAQHLMQPMSRQTSLLPQVRPVEANPSWVQTRSFIGRSPMPLSRSQYSHEIVLGSSLPCSVSGQENMLLSFLRSRSRTLNDNVSVSAIGSNQQRQHPLFGNLPQAYFSNHSK